MVQGRQPLTVHSSGALLRHFVVAHLLTLAIVSHVRDNVLKSPKSHRVGFHFVVTVGSSSSDPRCTSVLVGSKTLAVAMLALLTERGKIQRTLVWGR